MDGWIVSKVQWRRHACEFSWTFVGNSNHELQIFHNFLTPVRSQHTPARPTFDGSTSNLEMFVEFRFLPKWMLCEHKSFKLNFISIMLVWLAVCSSNVKGFEAMTADFCICFLGLASRVLPGEKKAAATTFEWIRDLNVKIACSKQHGNSWMKFCDKCCGLLSYSKIVSEKVLFCFAWNLENNLVFLKLWLPEYRKQKVSLNSDLVTFQLIRNECDQKY